MKRIRRLKSGWWVFRNGPPSITFKAEPGQIYQLPSFQAEGPMTLWFDGGTLTGTITNIEGPPPVAVTKDGEFEMLVGPYVLKGREDDDPERSK